MAYRVGGVWQPEIQVANRKTGVVGEPGSITMTVLKPSGREEVVEPNKQSPGTYEPQVKLTEAGVWELNVSTSGALEASETVEIPVKPKFG